MASKKKRVDAAKQREKRTKIAAIVGVVLLVAVGAYEIPSMLKVMNKKPPGNTRYDPGPSLTPGGLPNVATSGGASPVRQWAVVYLQEPTLIGSTIVQGPVLFTHDDARMARGEPCTTVQLFGMVSSG